MLGKACGAKVPSTAVRNGGNSCAAREDGMSSRTAPASANARRGINFLSAAPRRECSLRNIAPRRTCGYIPTRANEHSVPRPVHVLRRREATLMTRLLDATAKGVYTISATPFTDGGE